MADLYITNVFAEYRRDWANSLSKAGYRICYYMQGDVPVRYILGKAFLKDPVALLEQERPAHVIVPEFSGIALQMALLRKRFGIKVVSMCDDSLDMVEGNDFTGFHRLARRLLPGRLDGIIVHGKSIGNWYRDRYGIGNLLMPIMNDERRIRPELERVLPLAREIRPTEKPIVAFVGRLVGLKNIPTLIRAFEPLKERAQLVIVGDGPEREALESLAPDAVFTGMRSGDDLLAWYDLIDILVLPSTQEAYGAVVGEALMAGAKVVVSRKAGACDLVRVGENGYIVDPDDAGEMTSCISRLLDTVETGRGLSLRENLHPYRFVDRVNAVIDGIRSL
ncbi:MAG: glycosyltransferase family 4 protein [Bacteroidales bacterium]|nr:glycosyltransferase family 4 protein [Bacteroidales bacterium]